MANSIDRIKRHRRVSDKAVSSLKAAGINTIQEAMERGPSLLDLPEVGPVTVAAILAEYKYARKDSNNRRVKFNSVDVAWGDGEGQEVPPEPTPTPTEIRMKEGYVIDAQVEWVRLEGNRIRLLTRDFTLGNPV